MPTKLQDWRFRSFVAVGVSAWFSIVYFIADQIAGASDRYRFGFEFEQHLPFIPSFGVVYLSITPLLLLPLLVLEERRLVGALAWTMAIEIAIAGVLFSVFPLEPPHVPVHASSSMFQMADAVNLRFNCFPSLHVALALSACIALHPHLGRASATGLWMWTALLVASTVLIRQHFVADAVGGAILAVVAMKMIYPHLAGRRRLVGITAAER